jgi:hypothetical protein
MTAGSPAGIDNGLIQMGTHQTHFMTVLSCGESQRGAHHTRTDNGYDCHKIISFMYDISSETVSSN